MERAEYEKRFNFALDRRDKNDLHGAIRELSQLVHDEHQKPAPVYGMLGHLYFLLGDFENALINNREATRHGPKSELASLGLFHTLWELGRKDEALSEARRFIALRPSAEYELLFTEIGRRP
jgi:tetratricopeptide (TPR) repeat protein